jgi:hypothetical protein
VQEARSKARSQVSVSYGLLVEAVRLKLDRKLKTRFEKEFKEGLAAPPQPADALGLLQHVASLERAGVTYHGQKTHRTRALALAKKVPREAWNEQTLQRVIDCLLSLKAIKDARTLCQLGQRRFPKNPYVVFFEACTYFLDRPGYIPFYQVRALLDDAERLARDWPPDDRRERLLEEIRGRRQAVDLLDPFSSFASGFMGGFDDFDDDEDEFEDEDDYEDGDGW